MKKILAGAIMAISSFAFAGTTVPLVWPFSAGSNQANALRAIIENANKAQDKYTFIFENKPGAGGSVAVNYVANSQTPAVLLITQSVITRPILYPNSSHQVEDMVPVAIASTGSPITVMSKKFKSLAEMQQAGVVNLGIVNGGFTEIVGRAMQAKMPNAQLIPYNGTLYATQDALGGFNDASIDFIHDSMTWIDSGSLNAVAVTGTKSMGLGRFKTFSAQGFSGFENLVINYFFLTNKKVSKETIEELNKILVQASNQENVKAVWKGDEAETSTLDVKGSTRYWEDQKRFWTNHLKK